MSKVILAALLAVGLNAFANDHEGAATDTPATEQAMPAATTTTTGEAAATHGKKMAKAAKKGAKEAAKEMKKEMKHEGTGSTGH